MDFPSYSTTISPRSKPASFVSEFSCISLARTPSVTVTLNDFAGSGVISPDYDSQPASGNLAFFYQVFHNGFYHIDRDGESDTLITTASGKYGGINAQ